MTQSRHTPFIHWQQSEPPACYTVVVQGLFRGGTSIVAHVVHELGIPLVKDDHTCLALEGTRPQRYDNLEDLEFQRILHPPVMESWISQAEQIVETEAGRLDALIAARNASLDRWGWKYPGNAFWLASGLLAGRVRNPRIITIYRDPVATARHVLEISPNPLPPKHRLSDFRFVQRQYDALLRTLELDCPQFIISMERLGGRASAIGELIDGLAEFLGVVVDDEKRVAIEGHLNTAREAVPQGPN